MSTSPSPVAQPLLDILTRRKLALPALLFVAGHRPLAFAVGQALLAVGPFVEVLGSSAATQWGLLLSDAEQSAAFQHQLVAIVDAEADPQPLRNQES